MTPLVVSLSLALLTAVGWAAQRHAAVSRARADTQSALAAAVEARRERDAAIKRVEAQAREEVRFAAAPLLGALFQHLDTLERAAQTPDAEGLRLIAAGLQGVLRREGVECIAPEPGEPFDPRVHEALGQIPASVPEGHVARRERVGYQLHGRLLRPAQVLVAEAPAP